MNTSKSPLIGITVYNSDDESYYYPNDYIHAVRLAQGIPLLLPPGESETNQMIRALDGIILTGGGDINPALYSDELNSKVYWVNDLQDKSELNIAKAALESNKPVLATCRGMQLINILFGGTLHQHLPQHYGDTIAHRSADNQSVEHDVTVCENSMLANLMDTLTFPVKSWHHQSIRTLAQGFRGVGYSDDGVIEAIESDQHPGLIAVQWHPEIDTKNKAAQQKLFTNWISTCV